MDPYFLFICESDILELLNAPGLASSLHKADCNTSTLKTALIFQPGCICSYGIYIVSIPILF